MLGYAQQTTPTFTGLPPHVVILATCEELKFELAKAKGGIIQDIKDDLDLRRIGSQSHYDKEEIIHKMGALHDAFLKRLLVLEVGGMHRMHHNLMIMVRMLMW